MGSISEDSTTELQRMSLLFMKFSELVAFLRFPFLQQYQARKRVTLATYFTIALQLSTT